MTGLKTYLENDSKFLDDLERKFDNLPWVNDVSLLLSLDKICYKYTKELARNRLILHKCRPVEKNLRIYRNYAIRLK